jgi:sugar/nucleoside kinase (ribokinase family)
MAMAAAVRARGGRVTVDASAASLVSNIGRDAFEALVGQVGASVLFANHDEAAALGLDTGAPPAGLTVIVKDGPRPVRILTADAAPIVVPAVPVADVRDTTGAGDAFAAGTLAAWIRGTDLPGACRAGHRLAAQVLATPGAGGQAPPASPTSHPQGVLL